LKNGRHQIIVKDDGVGLPESLEIPKPGSLGMQLITILTEQLGGKLSMKSKDGAEFKIVFPSQQI